MKALTATLAVAGLALALPSAAQAQHRPGARAAPQGSYLRSCHEVRAWADSVSATCRTRSGRLVRARVDGLDRCIGDIANLDGQLVCTRQREVRARYQPQHGTVPPARAHLPDGSYARTCVETFRQGPMLYATCQTRRGGWVQTELFRPAQCLGDIANLNGQLTCVEVRRYQAEWSYQPATHGSEWSYRQQPADAGLAVPAEGRMYSSAQRPQGGRR